MLVVKYPDSYLVNRAKELLKKLEFVNRGLHTMTNKLKTQLNTFFDLSPLRGSVRYIIYGYVPPNFNVEDFKNKELTDQDKNDILSWYANSVLKSPDQYHTLFKRLSLLFHPDKNNALRHDGSFFASIKKLHDIFKQDAS
jgi:hypothetical protein